MVLKVAVTVFTSLPFCTLLTNDLIFFFFGHLKKSVCEQPLTLKTQWSARPVIPARAQQRQRTQAPKALNRFSISRNMLRLIVTSAPSFHVNTNATSMPENPAPTYFCNMSCFFCSSDVGRPCCFRLWSYIIFSTIPRVSPSKSDSFEFSGLTFFVLISGSVLITRDHHSILFIWHAQGWE